MELTDQDYEALKPYRTDIYNSARLGSVSNTSPFFVMAEIKKLRTGENVNGLCPSCVLNLYREFWQLISDYETKQVFEK